MQLQMPVWMPAINHKERVFKVKARPDGESRGQRDFLRLILICKIFWVAIFIFLELIKNLLICFYKSHFSTNIFIVSAGLEVKYCFAPCVKSAF